MKCSLCCNVDPALFSYLICKKWLTWTLKASKNILLSIWRNCSTFWDARTFALCRMLNEKTNATDVCTVNMNINLKVQISTFLILLYQSFHTFPPPETWHVPIYHTAIQCFSQCAKETGTEGNTFFILFSFLFLNETFELTGRPTFCCLSLSHPWQRVPLTIIQCVTSAGLAILINESPATHKADVKCVWLKNNKQTITSKIPVHFRILWICPSSPVLWQLPVILIVRACVAAKYQWHCVGECLFASVYWFWLAVAAPACVWKPVIKTWGDKNVRSLYGHTTCLSSRCAGTMSI